jgi:hypothetical protein
LPEIEKGNQYQGIKKKAGSNAAPQKTQPFDSSSEPKVFVLPEVVFLRPPPASAVDHRDMTIQQIALYPLCAELAELIKSICMTRNQNRYC